MSNLPIKAFCLNTNSGKIEIIINKVLGYPESTSIEGGYDFIGSLDIVCGIYEAHYKNYYSSTGILLKFLLSLEKCYASLEGTAEYKHLYEKEFEFTLSMTKFGHAKVSGVLQTYSELHNKLMFEMQTDQTCILEAINDLNIIADIIKTV